jgi:uncharacterized surface protein with fasciclin (FAS1) repeats
MKTCAKRPTTFGVAQLPLALLASLTGLILLLAVGANKGVAGSHEQDIVDTAVAAGSFKTLVTALEEAGLVETLKGQGPFTVFAPTDEAFAKIPQDQLNALLADQEKLTAVLTYHVVAGKAVAADVKSGPLETVQGQTLTVEVSATGVRVDNAQVIQADVMASNGVIHVIDTVLMPE